MKRILVAGLIAGLALFVWEFIAHEALPLGEAGFRALPDEPSTLAILKSAIRAPGLYIFPAPNLQPGLTASQKDDAMQKMMEQTLNGPTGLMIFHPNGVPFSFPHSLAIQLAADVVVMWIAAYLLSKITRSAGFGQRAIFVALLGFIPTLRTDIPYWNWYNFPPVYMLSQLTVHLVGFTLGGIILAKMVRAFPK